MLDLRLGHALTEELLITDTFHLANLVQLTNEIVASVCAAPRLSVRRLPRKTSRVPAFERVSLAVSLAPPVF